MNGRSSQGKGGVTPMVEHLAAKELAFLTAQPIDTKIDLKVSPSDAALTLQQEMNDQVKALVNLQKQEIIKGTDIIEAQVIGIDFGEIGKDNS